MISILSAKYEAYRDKSREVRRKAPIFAGALGLGSDPRKHPCHEMFYEDMLQWVQEFVDSQPSAQDAMAVAQFIMEEPDKYRGTDAYWFMYVVVGCIRSLIPFLTKEDCAALAARFDQLYPKRERMPVQMETYKKLLKASK